MNDELKEIAQYKKRQIWRKHNEEFDTKRKVIERETADLNEELQMFESMIMNQEFSDSDDEDEDNENDYLKIEDEEIEKTVQQFVSLIKQVD